MTPEQLSRLRSKRWLNNAKKICLKVGIIIAGAIGKPPSTIAFTDEEETVQVSQEFSKQVLANKVIELPNRSLAIEHIKKCKWN